MFQKFERNTIGRDFAVGDIHGQFGMLRMLLIDIGFDMECDRLFSVGDLVDRGPQSEEVLAWLGESWFHPVMGNHEEIVQRFVMGRISPTDYLSNGGAWLVGKLQSERVKYADALSTLPIAIEVDTAAGSIGIVHADCPVTSWRDFTERLGTPPSLGREAMVMSALWARDRAKGQRHGAIEDVTAVVVGHTPQPRVTSLDNVFFIDTGAGHKKGRLTIVELGPRADTVLREIAHS